MSGLVLGGSAVALAAAFVALAALGDLAASAATAVALLVLASLAYGIAAVWIVRRPPAGPRALVGILAAGAIFRLILLASPPSLSTDVYRYLWDGRVAVAGLSPYRYPADAPELARLRDAAVFPRLNHAGWRTIYPPGAQLFFAGMARLAPGSAGAFKAALVAIDLAVLGGLAVWLRALGRPPAWALVYGWHPLVVVEVAGSGHLDGVAVAATVGALWMATRDREGWAGALLGAGALVKLYPLLLLPAVWRRRPGRAIGAATAVLAAGYALYLRDGGAVLGSLGRYLAEEEFNPGVRGALDWALGGLGGAGHVAARALPLAALAVLAGAIGLWGREIPAWRRARWLIGGYLLLTPNLFPWYALWMIPVLAVAPAWPWLWLTCAVGLTYRVFAEPTWAIPAWVVVAEFGPLVLGLALAAGWRWAGAWRVVPARATP